MRRDRSRPLVAISPAVLLMLVACGHVDRTSADGPASQTAQASADASAGDRQEARVLLLAARWTGSPAQPRAAAPHLVLYDDGLLVRVLPDGSVGEARLQASLLGDVRQRLRASGFVDLPDRVDGLSATVQDAGSVLLHSAVLDATTTVYGFDSLKGRARAVQSDVDSFAADDAIGPSFAAVAQLRRLVDDLTTLPLPRSRRASLPASAVEELLTSLND